MSKNNITEDMLRESVARGIPKPSGYIPHSSYEEDKPIQEAQTHSNEPRKRFNKSMGEAYIGTYLNKVDFTSKQLIYVSKGTHKRLADFVQIVGNNGITLSSYVENIIKQHIDENQGIIDGLIKINLDYNEVK